MKMVLTKRIKYNDTIKKGMMTQTEIEIQEKSKLEEKTTSSIDITDLERKPTKYKTKKTGFYEERKRKRWGCQCWRTRNERTRRRYTTQPQ